MTVITNVSTVGGIMSNEKYTAASTSKADKVIDALNEVQQELSKPAYQCNDCGSAHYTVRSPLGGYKIKVCAECGSKSYSSRANMAPLINSTTNTQGATRGPVKKQFKSAPDKHQPTYRHKGKKR